MNLKVIQVKYFLTWCIINLGNSSDTIKTKSLAGLKMDKKWQKLHKDRNVYRVFSHLFKTICCLGLQRNIPCGKAWHNTGLFVSFLLQWVGWSLSNGLVKPLSMCSLLFSRAEITTYPKLQPKNVQKASELLLWNLLSFETIIEITSGEVVVPFVHQKCSQKNLMDKSWAQKLHFDRGRGEKNHVKFESAFFQLKCAPKWWCFLGN